MTDSDWLSPRKMREYYVDGTTSSIKAAQKELYMAVVEGQIAARHNGRLLGPEWLNQIK